MQTKLTLRLEEDIINQIKIYAAKQDQSLSKFTESLFRKILNTDKIDIEKLTPIVKKYKGILKNKIKDDRDEIVDYLIDRHG